MKQTIKSALIAAAPFPTFLLILALACMMDSCNSAAAIFIRWAADLYAGTFLYMLVCHKVDQLRAKN